MAPAPDGAGEQPKPRAWRWAALMHRAFAIDLLACPNCRGRLRLIATLHDPAVIREILAHLGRSPSGQSPGPAPPEPGAEGGRTAENWALCHLRSSDARWSPMV